MVVLDRSEKISTNYWSLTQRQRNLNTKLRDKNACPGWLDSMRLLPSQSISEAFVRALTELGNIFLISVLKVPE